MENEEVSERRFTQDELNTAIREGLHRQAEEYDQLKQQAHDFEAKQERVDELQRLIAEAELQSTRYDIISEYGLSADDVVLLSGKDEASMRRQAEQLKRRHLQRAYAAPKRSEVQQFQDNLFR